MLREVENQIGIINKLASCIQDTRHWGYVQLHIRAMISQRIMQIAAGYEEANDCNELRHSDIRKICSGSDRVLASQPTMSCLENQPRRKELYSMAKVVVDLFVASYTNVPEIVILHCENRDSIVHGQQQLSLFNTYFGDSCFMPLLIYEGFSGKLITIILNPAAEAKV